jgi:hypothetical protein
MVRLNQSHMTALSTSGRAIGNFLLSRTDWLGKDPGGGNNRQIAVEKSERTAYSL